MWMKITLWVLGAIGAVGIAAGLYLGGERMGWWGEKPTAANPDAAAMVNRLSGTVAEHEAKIEASAAKVAEVEKSLGGAGDAAKKFAEALALLKAGHADHEGRIVALEARPVGVTRAELDEALAKAIASGQQKPVAAPVLAPAPAATHTPKAHAPRRAPTVTPPAAPAAAAPASPSASANVATKDDYEQVAARADSAHRRIDLVAQVIAADRKVVGDTFEGMARTQADACATPAQKSSPAASGAKYFRDNSGPSNPNYFNFR